MFKDRTDAGRRLAQALVDYRDQAVLVLAIPRGGVEIGRQIAGFLSADMEMIISRKLPLPANTESGFGAIAEDGSIFIVPFAARSLDKQTMDRIIYEQEDEIKRRIHELRCDRPLPEIAGRTVIIVDDGIAMGSTMRVCIMLCQKQAAAKIVVAVPVAGHKIVAGIELLVDRTIVLQRPTNFYAVAQVYENWYDVSDQEVLETMRKWNIEKQLLSGC